MRVKYNRNLDRSQTDTESLDFTGSKSMKSNVKFTDNNRSNPVSEIPANQSKIDVKRAHSPQAMRASEQTEPKSFFRSFSPVKNSRKSTKKDDLEDSQSRKPRLTSILNFFKPPTGKKPPRKISPTSSLRSIRTRDSSNRNQDCGVFRTDSKRRRRANLILQRDSSIRRSWHQLMSTNSKIWLNQAYPPRISSSIRSSSPLSFTSRSYRNDVNTRLNETIERPINQLENTSSKETFNSSTEPTIEAQRTSPADQGYDSLGDSSRLSGEIYQNINPDGIYDNLGESVAIYSQPVRSGYVKRHAIDSEEEKNHNTDQINHENEGFIEISNDVEPRITVQEPIADVKRHNEYDKDPERDPENWTRIDITHETSNDEEFLSNQNSNVKRPINVSEEPSIPKIDSNVTYSKPKNVKRTPIYEPQEQDEPTYSEIDLTFQRENDTYNPYGNNNDVIYDKPKSPPPVAYQLNDLDSTYVKPIDNQLSLNRPRLNRQSKVRKSVESPITNGANATIGDDSISSQEIISQSTVNSDNPRFTSKLTTETKVGRSPSPYRQSIIETASCGENFDVKNRVYVKSNDDSGDVFIEVEISSNQSLKSTKRSISPRSDDSGREISDSTSISEEEFEMKKPLKAIQAPKTSIRKKQQPNLGKETEIAEPKLRPEIGETQSGQTINDELSVFMDEPTRNELIKVIVKENEVPKVIPVRIVDYETNKMSPIVKFENDEPNCGRFTSNLNSLRQGILKDSSRGFRHGKKVHFADLKHQFNPIRDVKSRDEPIGSQKSTLNYENYVKNSAFDDFTEVTGSFSIRTGPRDDDFERQTLV